MKHQNRKSKIKNQKSEMKKKKKERKKERKEIPSVRQTLMNRKVFDILKLSKLASIRSDQICLIDLSSIVF